MLEAVRKTHGGKPFIYKRGARPKTLAEGYEALDLPCGQCAGCRLEKSRQWGIRIACEAAYWWEFHRLSSIFITLTYDEKHLPTDGSLVKEHLQHFVKRLRERLSRRDPPENFRYYAAGEYGSSCDKHQIKDCPHCGPIQRPHYHAILLGFDFSDKHHIGDRDGEPIYTSDFLADVWDKGLHEIGTCSFQSAAYVARYIMKKQTGPGADPEHYQRYCWIRDKFFEVEPEFAFMSKNPGLGMPWIGAYHNDVYVHDEMPIPGRGPFGKAPKYFDKLAEKWDLYDFELIREQRRDAMAEALLNGPTDEQRAEVQQAKMNFLKRPL